MFRNLFAVTLLLMMSAGMAQAQPILTLAPLNGALSGYPASTVGWGFNVSNDTNYLLVTSADFILDPTSPVIGTFNDFSGFNTIVVGPVPESAQWQQAFDFLGRTGIGSFTIDSGAATGLNATGNIVLTYDLYNLSPNDPAFDPDNNFISSGNLLSASASVAVQAVPEPSTFLLLGGGLVGLFLVKRKSLVVM
jgi:PEP-CTERM motif